MHIFRRHAAAQENFGVGTSAADALHITEISGLACAGAGDDERVGQPAFQRVAGGFFNRPVAQRHGVLDEHVGENLRGRGDAGAVTERPVSVAFDQPLIREHRAGMDVDADETPAARGTERQRGLGVVP